MSNEEKKIELVKKINQLAEICSANGLIGEDAQSLFIGESIKVVLLAASEEEHAKMLQKYVLQFLAEVEVLMGKKTLNQYLCLDVENIAN